jgi:hypothetical protein
MIQELELAVLTRDVPEEGLKAGDVGTIVLVHQHGAGYEVEFTTLTGHTVAVVTVTSDAVRAVKERELAHAREVA